MANHQDGFATNVTTNQIAGVTTTPLNSIPSVSAPFWIALDATNINGKYEIVSVSSKTATHINHGATTYAHTTAEEVRMVVPAAELDGFSTGWTPVVGTWVYASADAPTFTVTVPSGATTIYSPGMRVKLNQTTDKYFIITAVADALLTVYGGTDYTLTSATITSAYFSSHKVPVGFPTDPTKWTAKSTDTTNRSQATPTQNTWYNLGSVSLSVPIGAWKLEYSVAFFIGESTAADYVCQTTLSTANNSESDAEFTASGTFPIRGASASSGAFIRNGKDVVLATKTPYYLNTRTVESGVDSINNRNSSSPAIIRAVCAYL